jgi:hypothetical protein
MPVQAQKRTRLTAPTHSQSASRKWVVAALPQESSGNHCIGGWVGLAAGLDGTEYLVPTGIRLRDRTACSESLYRVHYSDRRQSQVSLQIMKLIVRYFVFYDTVFWPPPNTQAGEPPLIDCPWLYKYSHVYPPYL